MKPVRILFLTTADAPVDWVLADADGYVLTRGSASIGDPPLEGGYRTVLIVPGADVLASWLDLPAGPLAQMTAAAGWAMRSSLATPLERTTVVLGAAPTGQPRPAVFADTVRVDAWRHHAELLGAPADVVAPDHLLVPPPEADDAVSILDRGDAVILRGARLAASLEPDLAALMTRDRVVVTIEPGLAEAILIRGALNPPVNLLAASHRRAGRTGWRRTLVLAAALVASPLILTLAAASHDEIAARQIMARDRAIATSALRSLPPGADPLSELDRRLAKAPPPGGLIGAAAALFGAIEAVEGSAVESMTLEGGLIRVEVSYVDYGDVNAIQAALNRTGRHGQVESTLEDGGRITSTMTIGAMP